MVALFSPGSRCGELYEMKRLVARGPAAEWYEGVHTATGASAIVTCSRFAHIEGDALSGEAFSEIVGRIRAIPSPRVPRIYDWGVAGDVYWIASQPVDEPAMGELARYRKQVWHAWHVTDALAVATEAQAILGTAWSAGVLHGDLTPRRVRIAGMPHVFGVVLLDLGLAELFMLNREAARATPRYRSPEQLEGGVIDARSDIYSLGMCMYYGIAQAPPYWDKAPASHDPGLLKLALSEMPASLSLGGYCPKALRQFVEKAIQKDPERRFQSWDEVEDELADVANDLLKDRRMIAALLPDAQPEQLPPPRGEAAPGSDKPSTVPPGVDTRKRVARALAEARDLVAQGSRAPGGQGEGVDGSFNEKGRGAVEAPASPEPSPEPSSAPASPEPSLEPASREPSSEPASPEPSSEPDTLPSAHVPALLRGSQVVVRLRRRRSAYLMAALLAGTVGGFIALQAAIERWRKPLLEARSEARDFTIAPPAFEPPSPSVEESDERREAKISPPPVQAPPAPRVSRRAPPRAAATGQPGAASTSAPAPPASSVQSPCSETGFVCVGAETK